MAMAGPYPFRPFRLPSFSRTTLRLGSSQLALILRHPTASACACSALAILLPVSVTLGLYQDEPFTPEAAYPPCRSQALSTQLLHGTAVARRRCLSTRSSPSPVSPSLRNRITRIPSWTASPLCAHSHRLPSDVSRSREMTANGIIGV
ncbi:hypothetical protein LZ32DRAFT_53314 [Colletotrichum eremochloae]|nr:hypothetical protein LZ32DRAFT_53314 [Colletotrichum eremochloae]